MTGFERTFLAKYLPEDLGKCTFREIIDVYIPRISIHPKLRIRKIGNKFEITKKIPVNRKNSQLRETTIPITEEEFEDLKLIGKRIRKFRYYYPFNGKFAEIDIFQDLLKGLVLIDFEFNSEKEMKEFEIPDFCLAEVTQEEFIAGGILSGKSFLELHKQLKKFEYQRILMQR